MQYTLKKVLKYIKFKDIANVLVCLFVAPFALIAKIFIRDFWLVCEAENEARDNGYWFYKWVRENRPKQKIAYAINKKSPDYAKVKDLGKTVQYGSAAHWFWYIVADKNISSQKGGKPNAAVCYMFEVVLGMRKNNRIFLQHGVIKDDLKWLYYKNTYVKRFVTSSIYEYEYVKANYGYPDGDVILTGLPRFDNLHNVRADKDLVLVMPTWRNWLGRESTDNRHLDFTTTSYYKKWNEFLSSPELDSLLKKYNKRLLFYPHRNMQKFLHYFDTKSENIEIADWKKYDIQDCLKKAALMITDYSSVFFDFAYMRKPVIFYQFDEQEFRQRQYEEGYFDYHDTVLGKWSDNLEDLLSCFEDELKSGCRMIDEDVIKTIFPMWDTKNSERIYDEIKALKK